MMFKNHLETIGRNEPIQRKAKFWQSYVRALKGTDDMRAPEGSSRPRSLFRPLLHDFPSFTSKLDSWPYGKSIYSDPVEPFERIHVPGYRYLPISRETYGYTPRNLYPDRYRPDYYSQAWENHLRRMSNLDSLYPRKYAVDPLAYHLDTYYPSSYRYPSSYYWDKYNPSRFYWDKYNPRSYTPKPSSYYWDRYYPRSYPHSFYWDKYYVDPLSYHLDHRPKYYDWKPKALSWEPKKESPKEKALGYNYAGQPIYTRGGKRRLMDMLNDPVWSALALRNPWWHDYPELRPFDSPYTWLHSPSYLRDSYLSPVKSTYLWSHHPVRPFSHYKLFL